MPIGLQVLILISVGFILFLIELFTPGFGLCGISGLVLILWGCILSAAKINPLVGILIFIGATGLVILFFKLFQKSFLWRRMQLTTSEEKARGFTTDLNLQNLLNKQGKTLSPLRPVGTILIEGRRLEATTDGVFISENTDVTVVRVEGNKVVVKEGG